MMVRPRRGFTLIELLIVVVIIGILAAIAIPKFRSSKSKAFVASMKSDLHNLAESEEGYYFENHTYTADLSVLKAQVSQNVTITITEATDQGWAAMTSHPQAWPLQCALYVGTVSAPPFPGMQEGVTACQ